MKMGVHKTEHESGYFEDEDERRSRERSGLRDVQYSLEEEVFYSEEEPRPEQEGKLNLTSMKVSKAVHLECRVASLS